MNPYWTRTLEHVVSEGWIDRRFSGTFGICAVAGDVPAGCATVH